jgi:hypothetical protein
LENGIQVKGTGMDPGFHRGDEKAGMTEEAVDFPPANSEALRFDLKVVQLAIPSSSDLLNRRPSVGIAVINAFE